MRNFLGWKRWPAVRPRSVPAHATHCCFTVFAVAASRAIPSLPAVIVTQTLVKLLSELVYVWPVPTLGNEITAIETTAQPPAPQV